MKDKVKNSRDSLNWSWVCGCGGQGGGSSCGVDDILHKCCLLIGIVMEMSLENRSRSRSPMDRKMRTQRYSNRDEPYRRNARRGYRLFGLKFTHMLWLFFTVIYGLEERCNRGWLISKETRSDAFPRISILIQTSVAWNKETKWQEIF